MCRESTLPQEYIPEITAAVEKVGLKWDQFKVTDNSCPPHPPQESLVDKVCFSLSVPCKIIQIMPELYLLLHEVGLRPY